MATITLTNGNDTRKVIEPQTVRIDGRGGFDTIDWGTLPFFNFEITRNAQGEVLVDTISGASGGGLHATLINVERLTFESGRVTIDLATYFAESTKVGTAGNDSFDAGTGFVTIDGAAGTDTVKFAQTRINFLLSKTGEEWKVEATDGRATTQLKSVERLQFVDTKLALDLNGAAGIVAKTLGAVFGPASVANKEYAGIGLQLVDAGTSYEALMKLALDARLGVGASNTAVVDLLYTNVVGQPPPAADLASFVALLNNGTYTPATLGILAADHPLNIQHIDLVGLQLNGLGFL